MANPFTDKLDSVKNVGRFSSSLLNQFGAQRRSVVSNGTISNEFTFSRGNESFPNIESRYLTDKTLTTGAFGEDTYTAVQAYFESRGVAKANAAAMASITMDTAKMMGVSPLLLLEVTEPNKIKISGDAYNSLNDLRGAGDQNQIVSDVNNQKSLKARSIRA